MEKILAFLSEHSTDPISHRQAADYVQLSPAAFSRFFRRAIGKTYGEYLTELRLSNACRLMLETRHEISRIAFDVGFENLSTFHRSFRKVYQMAPRDFRRKTAGP